MFSDFLPASYFFVLSGIFLLLLFMQQKWMKYKSAVVIERLTNQIQINEFQANVDRLTMLHLHLREIAHELLARNNKSFERKIISLFDKFKTFESKNLEQLETKLKVITDEYPYYSNFFLTSPFYVPGDYASQFEDEDDDMLWNRYSIIREFILLMDMIEKRKNQRDFIGKAQINDDELNELGNFITESDNASLILHIETAMQLRSFVPKSGEIQPGPDSFILNYQVRLIPDIEPGESAYGIKVIDTDQYGICSIFWDADDGKGPAYMFYSCDENFQNPERIFLSTWTHSLPRKKVSELKRGSLEAMFFRDKE